MGRNIRSLKTCFQCRISNNNVANNQSKVGNIHDPSTLHKSNAQPIVICLMCPYI